MAKCQFQRHRFTSFSALISTKKDPKWIFFRLKVHVTTIEGQDTITSVIEESDRDCKTQSIEQKTVQESFQEVQVNLNMKSFEKLLYLIFIF